VVKLRGLLRSETGNVDVLMCGCVDPPFGGSTIGGSA
jgi:hypothetical protein